MNYEQFMLQEEQLDEVTKSLTKLAVSGARNAAGKETRRNAEANVRSKAGSAGDTFNTVTGEVGKAQDVKDNTKFVQKAASTKAGRKLTQKGVGKAVKSGFDKTVSKVKDVAKPVTDKLASAASQTGKKGGQKVGAKLLSGAGTATKAATGTAASAALTGVGIANATFRNKENQRRYANYSPKDTFGFGPGKTKDTYQERKPSEGTYAKELGGAAKKVKDTLTSNKNRGRTGAKKRTGK